MAASESSLQNQLYQQVDAVSIGTSLSPLLANVIMAELEQNAIKMFIDDKEFN